MSERLAKHCEIMSENNMALRESLKHSDVQKKRARTAMLKKEQLLKEVVREITLHPKYKEMKKKYMSACRENTKLRQENKSLLQKLKHIRSSAYNLFAMTKT
jgi:regulator of replication initiation timing